MESFNKPAEKILSGSEKKVEEYFERIKGGESKEKIFKDLPKSFREGINAKFAQHNLAENDKNKIEELKREIASEFSKDENKDNLNVNRTEKEQTIEKINEIVYEKYRQGKNDLKAELLAISAGMDIETGKKFFEMVSGEVGQFFDAHGIDKGDQVANLVSLLESGVDPERSFHTAPFEAPPEIKAGLGAGLGTAGGTAYKSGLAVVTSGFREKIKENGIKHVFINDAYAKIKEPLSKLFPQYQMHLLSEQKDVMDKDANANS